MAIGGGIWVCGCVGVWVCIVWVCVCVSMECMCTHEGCAVGNVFGVSWRVLCFVLTSYTLTTRERDALSPSRGLAGVPDTLLFCLFLNSFLEIV